MEGPDKLVATAAYQPEPMAAAAARCFVRDTLQSWIVAGAAVDGNGLVDDAVLLTSELVTNAVVHAGTPVQVTCRLADDNVEVVVRDGQPASLVPEPQEASPGSGERTSGWGLLLPSALASAWGVTYGRTAKAVWFRIGLDGPGTAGDEWADEPAGGDPAVLATALGRVLTAPVARPAAAGQPGCRPPAGPGYRELLQQTVEAARAAVGADAACALLADEDGELRLRAVAGVLSVSASPQMLTIPFVVDGRITGLLATIRAHAGSFRDGETARLQEVADRTGPALERSRLGDLERIRRERISALAVASDLLSGHLSHDKAMAMAGDAVVPRLSAWCAVLLPATDGKLRPAYTRHLDETRAPALAWLLEQVCAAAAVPAQAPPQPGSRHRAAWRWPLAGTAGDAPAAFTGTAGDAPAGLTGTAGDGPAGLTGTAALAADVACCFPFPGPGGGTGVLAAGCRQEERLPREAAVLIADLARRLGLALGKAALPGRSG